MSNIQRHLLDGDDANGVRPVAEVSFLRRLWTEGRPFEAIVSEMISLGWKPHEIDFHLGLVSGPLPVRAHQMLDEL